VPDVIVHSTSSGGTQAGLVAGTALFVLGFAALCFVVLTRHHWQQICDDAFIPFRYANNLAAGLGPVWNRGERVEGYSSPLWLGLLVLGRLAGAGLPSFAGVLGIAFSALCLLLVQRFALVIEGAHHVFDAVEVGVDLHADQDLLAIRAFARKPYGLWLPSLRVSGDVPPGGRDQRHRLAPWL